MGFKLKKKNTDGSSNRSGGNALVAKLQSQTEQFSRVFGDSEKSKPLILGAAFCIVLAIFLLLYLFYSVPRNNEFTRSLGDLRLLSQTISRQATEATASGTPEAIKKLTESQKSFAENLETVKDIHASTDALREVDAQWKKVSENIDLIASQQKIINQLYDTNIAISESIPGIQAEYNLMVDQMARQNVPANQVVIAKNQVFIAERILRSIGSVLTGSDNSRESADDFSSDTETFASYLNAQLNGSADLGVERINDPEMRDSLTSIQSEYDDVLKSAAATVLKNSSQIVKVRQASSSIFEQSDALLSNLNKLSGGTGLAIAIPALGLILALIAFLFCVFKLLVLRGESDKKRVSRLQDEYDRNQNAILRLLDEIADLADGDLRSYATVSEDFTGAIADSINFAIDQLRDLVSRITETSQEVAQYTASTQGITNQLAEASEHQAQEIAGASAAINEMAMSIDQVSSNAEESAVVAERSVKIAANGANVVNRSIEGMDIIREQIQETSKRIKRLGESSQEIGNIVALINDIADQTNILALNAAIQASMAGEAGRGFAVVADEVRVLSQRTHASTGEIQTMIDTLQKTTQLAVKTMSRGQEMAQKSVYDADEAHQSLEQIITAISNISDKSTQIASAAEEQTSVTEEINRNTSAISDVATDMAREGEQAAKQASELRELIRQVESEVKRFSL